MAAKSRQGETVEPLRPRSLEDLAKLSWQQFEVFSLEVIASMYKAPGLQFRHTPFSHDGGRDGDAQYVLGVGLDPSLEITFKIWLEVKKRVNTHVGKEDLGSHLVDASLDAAQTIIFVTNSKFSQNLGEWLAAYSKRTGVQHKLIDGEDLLLHAAKFLGEGAMASDPTSAKGVEALEELSPIVRAICWFSLSPSDHRTRLSPHPVIVRKGRPLYLNIELVVDDRSPSFAGFLQVRTHRLTATDCHPHMVSQEGQRLFTAGDVARLTYSLWPTSRTTYSGGDFELAIDSPAEIRIETEFLNSFELEYLSLPDTALSSQQKTYTDLFAHVDSWLKRGASALALLIAPPGAGKSYLVAKLRRRLLSQGLKEVYIDCETVHSDRALFATILQDLLPLPAAAPLDLDLRPAVIAWCSAVGLSTTAATEVADDLCGTREQASKLAPRHRADLLAMVLGESSRESPLVVVVEDLHKAAPSLVSLILLLVAALKSTGRGHIQFVLSTRPYSDDTGEVRVEWLKRLEALAQSEAVSVLNMEQPSNMDAKILLEASVRGFEDYNVEALTSAIGTVPYDLREGLLYLLATHALRLLDGDDAPPLAVANPLLLRRVLASPKLAQVTERRLKVLLQNQPIWLRQFLLAGAAFGRSFPVQTIAEAVQVPEPPEALDECIASCGLWSVASLSPSFADWLEFDHDLIRDTLLRTSPPRSRVRAAAALFARIEGEAPSSILARIAYQAGMAATSLRHTKEAASEAKRDERLDDLVELNQLAIQILDPNLTSISFPNDILADAPRIDAALRYAAPCRIGDLPPNEIHAAVLTLLLENLSCLASLASGSSGLSERTLVEATLIATRIGDEKAQAQLLSMEGRLHFERDAPGRALEAHTSADALFAQLGLKRNRARAENLIRLAICERSMGNVEMSFGHLAEAAKACPRGDWKVLNKIRNNTGAAFLKSDWREVRRHWNKQVEQGERHNLGGRVAHGLLSLAFLDLFEGDLESGAVRTRRAIELAEQLRLDNQKVRGALNMSVYCIRTKDYSGALDWLRNGERTALAFRIGRRLWRVIANLATVYELLGNRELCITRDRQISELLKESPANEGTLGRGDGASGRHLLPLINIALRRETIREAEYRNLTLPDIACKYADRVRAGGGRGLPNLLGKYCVELPVGPRFLLTE